MSPDLRLWCYRGALFVASILFLVGLRALTSAATARRGMRLAAVGMALGVAGTPYFVVLDGDNVVTAAFSGETTTAVLDAAVDEVTKS